jgi:hypothetical protein
VNGSRKIQGIDYTESFAPVVQWSTIHMVNTLAVMYNLKGKQIDLTKAFPKKKLKEDIYQRLEENSFLVQKSFLVGRKSFF